jgi:nicotinamide-nucleotide amidase
MHLEVIAIGNELLGGLIADGNFVHIARMLAAHGVRVRACQVLPDDPAPLREGIRAAAARSTHILLTGGLGATPDDLTREAVAEAFGLQLIARDELVTSLELRRRALGRAPDPLAARMTFLPHGAEPLANAVGMAPGFHLRAGTCELFALPGVPGEMVAMLRDAVIPRLALETLAAAERVATRVLRATGLSENVVASRIVGLLPPSVRVAYLPGAGRLDLRFAAAGDSAGLRALDEACGRVLAELGAFVYAATEVTLEAVVLGLLGDREMTLGVAESLTGGAIGQALTRVPGSSAVFLGGIVAYSNAAKEALLGVPAEMLATHGAVSSPVAAQMAAGAQQAFGARVVIATTGIAGPSGGSPEKPVGLVYFGLRDATRTVVFRRLFGGDRRMIQDHATTVALNLLRLHALGRLDLAGVPEPQG